MKRYSPHVLVLFVAVVLLFVLSRARRAEPDGSGGRLVVLSRLWAPPHEKQFVIEEILGPFEKEQGCSIDFQTLDDDALLKRMAVQKATGHVSVDTVIVYVSRMREWVDSGYVADLSPHAGLWDDRTFTKGFSNMTVFEGRQYFLPIGADDYLLCANRNALKYLPQEARLADLTWEQLADWALAISEGEGEGKFAFCGVAQKMLTYQLSASILSFGGGFPDIASPAAVRAWKLFVRMRTGFAPTIRTYDSAVPAMKRGEAWLTVTHSARVGEIYSSNPVKFLVAPPPRGPAGRGSVAGVSGLALVNGCPHPYLAVKFLEYMTRPAVQLKLARGTGGFIPTVSEATALLDNRHEDEVIRHAIAVLEDGVLAYIPTYRNWAGVKQAYDDAFHKLVLESGQLDTDYLKAAQKGIDSLRPSGSAERTENMQ